MLFRIEDSANSFGCHRKYSLTPDQLPKLKITDLETYLAEEIRKEVNNSMKKKLLSYSKSLGICLLKYNKFTDNELHIHQNGLSHLNMIFYYNCATKKIEYNRFDLATGIQNLDHNKKPHKIILNNFKIDVSNNNALDIYLNKYTNKGRKKVASPEKDKEVLLMQSPNDLVISQYIESVYLLHALYLKYGMKKSIYINLILILEEMDNYRFNFKNSTEREGLITIVNYLYHYGQLEKEMCLKIYEDSKMNDHTPLYYDPILQLHDIQTLDFDESFMLSDYNSNIVSDWIWHFYKQELINI